MTNRACYSFEYYKEMYLFYSKSDKHKRRVEKSQSVVIDFLKKDVNKTVNISGGKDSTAMCHLITRIEPTIKIVSEKDDMDFPNELDYLQSLKDLYCLNLDIICPSVSLWSVIKNFDITEDIHSKDTDFSETYFYKLLRDYQKKHNIQGVFLGLRAKESKGRLWNFKKNGYIYWNKTWQHWVCQPLAEWEAKDVFAYLFSNDIPILDVYFKNLLAEPEQIRKSWVLPSAQTCKGQVVWLKYYYPEIYNRLAILNPKIRTYV